MYQSSPQPSGGQPGNCPHWNFPKTSIVVWYNNKLQSLCSPPQISAGCCPFMKYEPSKKVMHPVRQFSAQPEFFRTKWLSGNLSNFFVIFYPVHNIRGPHKGSRTPGAFFENSQAYLCPRVPQVLVMPLFRCWENIQWIQNHYVWPNTEADICD